LLLPDGTRIESGLIGREGMTGCGLAVGDPQTPYELLMQIEGYAVVMAAEDFRQAVVQMPDLRLLASRFAPLAVQVSYTALANGRFELRQRLARWLLMVHDRVRGFSFNLTHEYLATMLGVRRSSVTDALHILEGDGLIRSTRNQIVIRDRSKLAVLAGPAYGVPEAEYAAHGTASSRSERREGLHSFHLGEVGGWGSDQLNGGIGAHPAIALRAAMLDRAGFLKAGASPTAEAFRRA
jgi:hypothetical protein